MTHRSGTVFVVLDSLDEAKNRSELLKFIEISSWPRNKLHILLASRDEPDIHATLVPLIQAINIIDVQQHINMDIRTHVRSRLSHDPALRKWRGDSKAQHDIEILCSINLSHQKTAIKAFQWLVCSKRLLRLGEIVDVLAIDVDAELRIDPDQRLLEHESIRDICSRLITITSSTSSIVGDKTHATEKRLPRLVRSILEEGVNLEARHVLIQTGNTALQIAAGYGDIEIVNLLVKFGADINAPGPYYGGRALRCAALKGHDDVVNA
ncbi:MAG: hypothetical protein Q9166_005212 [cf. Caloplaca sp. 2 TL-2023]